MKVSNRKMNLDFQLNPDKIQKFPYGFYFDSGLETDRACTVFVSEGLEKIQINFEKNTLENSYNCYVGLTTPRNICRPTLTEFNFYLFHNLEFNTYYIVNDFENCSDEFPKDNVTLEELDCFPEILKLFFMNPPEYVGMMM